MQPAQPYGEGQFYQQYPVGSTPPDLPAGRRFHLGDFLAGAGGLLIFLFSFAPFIVYSDGFFVAVVRNSDRDFDGWYTAWSTQMFMAPLTWWVIFAGLSLVVLAALRTLTGRDPRPLGFDARQLQVGLALFAFLVLSGYALAHKQLFFGLDSVVEDAAAFVGSRPEFGWGGAFMLIGAAVATAGAFLAHRTVGPSFPLPGSITGASASNGPMTGSPASDPAAGSTALQGGALGDPGSHDVGGAVGGGFDGASGTPGGFPPVPPHDDSPGYAGRAGYSPRGAGNGPGSLGSGPGPR